MEASNRHMHVCFVALVVAALAHLPLHVHSTLAGAFIFPHGGIALDPTHFHGNSSQMKDAHIINAACRDLGKMVAKLAPDLIILTSPHALANDINFNIALNVNGSGGAETEGNYAGHPLSSPLAPDIALAFVEHLRELKMNVSGLTAYSQDEDFPLRWAEVIPLLFVADLKPQNTIPVLLMAMPTRRYTQSLPMIPELLELGRHIRQAVESMSERVVLLTSGDLAHTHLASGPYGYSPDAEPFDKACGEWVTTQNPDVLLTKAAGYVTKALSCGFPGFVMMQGLLSDYSTPWISTLHANNHPSYYGMMAASYLPEQ